MVLDAYRKEQYNQNKFLAALKGINLEDDAAGGGRVEQLKEKLAAEAAGMSEEAYALDGFFGIEEE